MTQSAIKAGFSESYAKSHAYRTLAPLAEKYRKKRETTVEKAVDRGEFYTDMLESAEKGIYKRIKSEYNDPKMVQIQQKDQHFVAETLGKERYSKRTEVQNTGKNEVIEQVVGRLADALGDKIAAQAEPLRVDYEVKDSESAPERIDNDTSDTQSDTSKE
jgi:phage terminase small subunit